MVWPIAIKFNRKMSRMGVIDLIIVSLETCRTLLSSGPEIRLGALSGVDAKKG
jgi:hypothetical protein